MMIRPLDEVLTFIAAGHTTEEVACFEASPEAKATFADLVQKMKSVGLTARESAELESYVQLERMMQLAKAKARALLAK